MSILRWESLDFEVRILIHAKISNLSRNLDVTESNLPTKQCAIRHDNLCIPMKKSNTMTYYYSNLLLLFFCFSFYALLHKTTFVRSSKPLILDVFAFIFVITKVRAVRVERMKESRYIPTSHITHTQLWISKYIHKNNTGNRFVHGYFKPFRHYAMASVVVFPY